MADYQQILSFEKSVATATYTEHEVLLPQYPDGSIPCICGIDIEHPALAELDDKNSRWAITTKSGSTTPATLGKSETLLFGRRHVGLTTSGVSVEDCVEHVEVYPPIPVTSPKLYLQLLQDSGSSHTYSGRIRILPRVVNGLVQRTVQNVAQF